MCSNLWIIIFLIIDNVPINNKTPICDDFINLKICRSSLSKVYIEVIGNVYVHGGSIIGMSVRIDNNTSVVISTILRYVSSVFQRRL